MKKERQKHLKKKRFEERNEERKVEDLKKKRIEERKKRRKKGRKI